MITVKVGMASCGIAAGANEVYNTLKEHYKDSIVLKKVGCIGTCYAEPIIEVKKDDDETIIFSKVTKDNVIDIIESLKENRLHHNAFAKRRDGIKKFDLPYLDELEFFKIQHKRVSELCGIIDPENIDDYLEFGGYEALKKALQMKRKEILEMITQSGLRGRGGAGFPTGKKWEFVFDAEKPKYLICNFDEGDPGAFMNRVLVESNPHLLIEGILIASYVLDVDKAFIYTRAEYPLAVKRLKIALHQAKEKGIFGENGMIKVDIEIRLGAGAYVCGEETALIASIEGKPGRPRPKPPYPAQKGLFGRPTVINNVETLANVPLIVKNGVDWFRAVGTSSSPGTKMFSFSGGIKNTGYIEVPLGTKLKDILSITGVSLDQIKGVQLGGPSGGCLSKEFLDLPIDYENVPKADAIMGSGSFVIIPNDTDIVEFARYFLEFNINESCGQCTPCREGLMRMKEILDKILAGEGSVKDMLNLEELALFVKEASLCGLGKAAPNPVICTIKHFREEYVKHFKYKVIHDPTEVYYILPEKCTGCNVCTRVCPVKAITGRYFEVHTINQDLCIRCGQCQKACGFNAIVVKSLDEIKNAK